MESLLPVLAVFTAALAVPLILISGSRPNVREFWTILAAAIKFLLVLSILPYVWSGKILQSTLFEILPGIPILLKADTFGVYFAIIASGLWIFTSFYSIGYVRGAGEKHQTRYFASFALCLTATLGIAFSGNLVTFLLFYEMLTLSTYPLVIHKETKKAIDAGRKYLAYTLTAGVLLVAAVGLTYYYTGSIDFQVGGLFRDSGTPLVAIVAIFLLFLGAVGVKAGIMPLHSWLPAAMAAPTPVSSLLHAVAVVKSGVFGIIRVVGFVFGPEVMAQFGLNQILMIMAGSTIILASLLAFQQDNLKKRLAYSTVGHLSYIVLGAALLTELGMQGAIMHIAAHATMKITLFFAAGAIYVNLHRENISQLNGIGKAMPWTMSAFAIGSMGLAGIPPINGFLSKWYLALGSLQGDMLAPLFIFILSGLLNLGYFFPVVRRAFFEKPEGLEGKGEASPLMVVPLTVTAILSVLLGLFPNLFFKFFDMAVQVSQSLIRAGGV
ncbi:MAG: cation:proton antiporter [Spirochaetaceae bacterium]|nr:cation:proton antiporter [Spirochaetaceae bacterium]|tara:strand:- start:446524 stop:448008 length:1485 start_codon:yes stop_codon:yes gene_type:complete